MRSPGCSSSGSAYGYDVEIPAFARFTRGKLPPRKFVHPTTGEKYTRGGKWRFRAQIRQATSKYVDTIAQRQRKPGDGDAE